MFSGGRVAVWEDEGVLEVSGGVVLTVTVPYT